LSLCRVHPSLRETEFGLDLLKRYCEDRATAPATTPAAELRKAFFAAAVATLQQDGL
jgi:hypothetical protein